MRSWVFRVLAALGVLMAVGVLCVALLLRDVDDTQFGGEGPHRADLVARPVGVPGTDAVLLEGDLLVRSGGDGWVSAQPVDDMTAAPVRLFEGRSVSATSPDGRHLVAWTGSSWLVVRLSDLRAVAEVEGGKPFFVDADRVLTVFEDRGRSRRDATLLDLRLRTSRRIDLSGDKARLEPTAVVGGQVVAQG